LSAFNPAKHQVAVLGLDGQHQPTQDHRDGNHRRPIQADAHVKRQPNAGYGRKGKPKEDTVQRVFKKITYETADNGQDLSPVFWEFGVHSGPRIAVLPRSLTKMAVFGRFGG
jgi:hypothetical protein